MDFKLSEEQRMWQESIHAFVAKEVKPKARFVDETASFNWDAVHKMGPLGLLGLFVPEAYGGSEMDAISSAIAMEELGWACGSTALSIAAHNGLGCAALALFGSHELKVRYLTPAAKGNHADGSYSQLAALALTEPGAGSDLKGGVITRAEYHNGYWTINGTKMWCTNASIADFIVTLVRTEPGKGSHSLSMILVPTECEGLHIGAVEKKLGVRGSPTNEVTYQDVCVPADHLVGKLGEGLTQTLTVLDGGRISIGAISVGLAQSALEEAVQYAMQRNAFEQPIASFQAIQWMLADAATEIQAARLMVYYAAWLKSQGKSFTKEASMAKLFATEIAERVCRNAIQILGSYGYSQEYPVERLYRDARLMTIGEGTSEIQRLVIARKLISEFQ